MKKTIVIIFIFAFVTIEPVFASQTATNFFNFSLLSKWKKGLTKNQTLPYISEQIQAEFLTGVLSPLGSYIFVTLLDNTITNQAFTTDALNSYASIEAYPQFAIESFDKQINTIDVHNSYETNMFKLKTFETTIRVKGYSNNNSTPSRLIVIKTVFFPVILRKGNLFFNYLIMVDFRGDSANDKEIKEFDVFCNSFRIPKSYRMIDINAFNVMQPELADIFSLQNVNNTGDGLRINTEPKASLANKLKPIIDVY